MSAGLFSERGGGEEERRGEGIHRGRMDEEEEEGKGGCDFISSSHYLIHILLHMSGGKGVSVGLVSICMAATIPLIHGISPSPLR